jgi:23S rRNA (cytidine1920-2'-O)/16S rRNA (cytidine1409-2'-O)-methyltransferase
MNQKIKKKFLHELLTGRGFCSNQKEAESWIMAGKVIVEGNRIDKPGQKIPENAHIRIKGMRKYVGKGGLKLEGALADFSVVLEDRIVLDAGASTGGFTDCLLQHGAGMVFSVDAGHGTLAGKLRNHHRVINLENTNISDLDPDQLNPKPSFATVDLSYISLKKAIPIIVGLLEDRGEMICLVKPLFEVGDSRIRRSGKISDPFTYVKILLDLKKFVENLGLKTTDLAHSHQTGAKGTREFFMRISLDRKTPARYIDIERTVKSALMLPTWKKDM